VPQPDRGHTIRDPATRFVIRFARRLVLLAALAAGLVAVGAGAAPAATPCGVALINDWYDGHIDKTYDLHCYKDALKIVGQRSDIDIYSNARQDILLALQAAIAAGRGGGGGGPDGYLGSTETADAFPSFLGGPNAGNGGRGSGNEPVTITKVPTGPVKSLINAGNSSASSVPLPAIVLGSIALLLLALGLAAYIARRRRQTLRPQPEGPQKP
jgi:hypothetical protein